MKHSRIIEREDGSKVKIVSELFPSPFTLNPPEIESYVLIMKKGEDEWSLIPRKPITKEMNMSVEEYVKHGRPLMFYAASIAEILITQKELMDWYKRGITPPSKKALTLQVMNWKNTKSKTNYIKETLQ